MRGTELSRRNMMNRLKRKFTTFINSNRDMEFLFFYVWRNNFLKNLIFEHMRIYQIVNRQHKIQSLETLSRFKYRGYIQTLTLLSNSKKISVDKKYRISKLSSTPTISSSATTKTALPSFITSKSPLTTTTSINNSQNEINYYQKEENNFYNNGNFNVNRLHSNLIPESVTELFIERDMKFVEGDIPDGLKKITFNGQCKCTFNIDLLPSTIQSIRFEKNTILNISLDSDKQFPNLRSLSVEGQSCSILKYSNCFKNLKKLCISNYPGFDPSKIIIPGSVEHLIFGSPFNKELPEIGNNVKSILLTRHFQKTINFNKLPAGLTDYSNLSNKFSYHLNDFKRFRNLVSLCYKSDNQNLSKEEVLKNHPKLTHLAINGIVIIGSKNVKT